MRKNKLLLLLALLMTAATGAWATDYTTLAVGDVIKVGDTFSPTDDGAINDWGVDNGKIYTLIRADIDNEYNVTEKTDGAYYVFKYVSIMSSPYIHFDKAFEVTAISDGLEVTKFETVKGYLFYTLALHESAAAAAGYTVSMKDGVKDADKWTISPNPAEEGQTVTLQYTGRLKVKGVTATSEAAAPSVPEGAISGVFSVSDGKQVYFSKGNLRYASGAWSFFDNQYDYYTDYSADAWDKFGWSTSATTYGMNTSDQSSDYSGDFVDWGATMGTGWFTLSKDEWTYLFNTRTVNGGTGSGKSYTLDQSVNGKLGVVIYPDNYTGEVYSGSDWATFESAGCVFLPAAGFRSGTSVYYAGSRGYYWSSSPGFTNDAYRVYFTPVGLYPADGYDCYVGFNVRLVREVATSDEQAAKPAATVTTAPTGAAIVGRLNTNSTELVSGGVAEGGKLMYAVTTTNTKPTSTAGFSEAVPTAQSIKASGTVYVWYYVKGDDSHSDSEIAATAIEVPVADIVWDVTNVGNLEVFEGGPYTKEGVTLSANAHMIHAIWADTGDPEYDGISFNMDETGGFTFTAPAGKAFTKIEMKANSKFGWIDANLGTGWAFNAPTVTWKGTAAASTVDLLTGAEMFYGAPVKYIVFYLSE